MNIVRIWFNPQYQCTTAKSLFEQSVTLGAKNVGILHRLKSMSNTTVGIKNCKQLFYDGLHLRPKKKQL